LQLKDRICNIKRQDLGDVGVVLAVLTAERVSSDNDDAAMAVATLNQEPEGIGVSTRRYLLTGIWTSLNSPRTGRGTITSNHGATSMGLRCGQAAAAVTAASGAALNPTTVETRGSTAAFDVLISLRDGNFFHGTTPSEMGPRTGPRRNRHHS
jgi:hypothetical protein